ncbi:MULTISPECIES: Crp/Fnr family transcriptional regulator [unclassified Rhizobium]|uniref:Crp/Fnr family transcriptional regulator n=1 Tax=unclassified Rhizobium TaxID=2613769 RepID=UPI001C837C09|nr:MULTISPECIES: helix-turn-helix domain-containing protein [unclassified Rhizobium]MBX5218688.1 helix-turn-helix domain-containing protein [Rhizobium sp. NLR9a]MBX5248724.1 helix-turn-helix domain-containing protein [Rhizobium sp. NLR3b]MBX5254789.1 helix-turn-helix domain-containing protein [Rhizobium sp. NLR4b]MBX5273285.1 helix-turn-helix domain-containing protein [Rhizobium sp. NLR17b]MBX5279390.1 helix-turn-helix domain-containing protein [Rhizobium sp. NLR13a]
MLMQNNHAFENAEQTGEAINAGQSLSSLFRSSAAEPVAAGKAICWEGDQAKHLFQVEEGVVRLHRIIGEGRRVITAFHFAGDLIGASLQNDFIFTAEAVTECKIRRMSRKSFHEEVVRSDALGPAYISLLCQEAAAAHEQMVLLSKKNAEERLCSFIVKLASRRNPRPRQGLVRVPMNRQDIADHLGLTIETVSRTITKLASRNIVIPEGRHDLRIVNLARLKQLSGDADDFTDDSCHRVNLH